MIYTYVWNDVHICVLWCTLMYTYEKLTNAFVVISASLGKLRLSFPRDAEMTTNALVSFVLCTRMRDVPGMWWTHMKYDVHLSVCEDAEMWCEDVDMWCEDSMDTYVSVMYTYVSVMCLWCDVHIRDTMHTYVSVKLWIRSVKIWCTLMSVWCVSVCVVCLCLCGVSLSVLCVSVCVVCLCLCGVYLSVWCFWCVSVR